MADYDVTDPDFSTVASLLTTQSPGHANTFNPLFLRLLKNDAFLKETVELQSTKKVELYIAETLPIISDRKKNTMYLKVTSILDTGISNNLKVSPAMGIKIVQEEE